MSANAAKGKIISLSDARKARLTRTEPAFNPEAVAQRINRLRAATLPPEAARLVQPLLEDATLMLGTLGIMGGEIQKFREQTKILAQQSTDAATINSVLLAAAGGEVRVDRQWFVDYEVRGGFAVEETDTEVIIRLIGVDDPATLGVGSSSATQQTEED